MIDGREDQAAGLRRLFRKAPPTVVALFSTGHHAPTSAARAIERIGHQAHRVLVLDEAAGAASLGAVWGHPASGDLLLSLDDRQPVESLVLPVDGLMGRLPVTAAAMALPLLDDERRDRLLGAIRALQRRTRFMLVHASAQALDAPSPFVFAAPRRLLVVEATGRGVTEAYACLKSLAALGAGAVHVAVARARDRSDAQVMFARLEALVRERVGIPLAWVGEVERDDLAAALLQDAGRTPPAEAEAAFLRRLQGWRQGGLTALRV
ncbi:MinD/ParA family protein [Nitrogeniibacter mangrovi]|uniref:MinD/ParA family protein n=1 Tax=Nitrogeniibacter mangrovi TaxID=2016596 RepID=A0A6C1B410_9RHOO|nr:flagellar FleN [Nitrogeniibacter mangrovi]QID18396.1 MinD/ParA family protein [Nitrogeniibacter mangrovi]